MKSLESRIADGIERGNLSLFWKIMEQWDAGNTINVSVEYPQILGVQAKDISSQLSAGEIKFSPAALSAYIGGTRFPKGGRILALAKYAEDLEGRDIEVEYTDFESIVVVVGEKSGVKTEGAEDQVSDEVTEKVTHAAIIMDSSGLETLLANQGLLSRKGKPWAEENERTSRLGRADILKDSSQWAK